jgi:hypothetical protein
VNFSFRFLHAWDFTETGMILTTNEDERKFMVEATGDRAIVRRRKRKYQVGLR